jgi:hypothetical protein
MGAWTGRSSASPRTCSADGPEDCHCGTGQAGLAAATKLRQEGFEGLITVLGDECVMPYQRPPLSKAYLLGKLEAERLQTTEHHHPE